MNTTPKQRNVFVVGLAGPSDSGKATEAKRVASRLNGHVLSMGIHCADMNHLPLDKRLKLDYDTPEAIAVKLLESHSASTLQARPLKPPNDFAQHLRVKDRREHIPAKFLLIAKGKFQ